MTTPNLRSKLLGNINLEPPALRQVGLKLAKIDGINLAQGLCLLPTPKIVKEAAQDAIRNGHNMYGPAQGMPELRKAITQRLKTFNKLTEVTEENVLVTPGSTGAFEAFCACFLEKGDEILSFIPFYPYHRNTLHRLGVKTNYVKFEGTELSFDAQAIRAAITPKTKAFLIVNPNNPTGKVFTREELQVIADICIQRDIICITDEVYEYMTYDGRSHISIASLPGMFERTITMSSYSKTFAVTGWRVGFLVASTSVIDALRIAADSIYVCGPTPLQLGVAHGISHLGAEYYTELLATYSKKRTIMLKGLEAAGLTPIKPQGAYFILASTKDRFPGKTSEAVVDILLEKARVGAVPATDFVGIECKGDPNRSNFLRFSFGVADELLEEAAHRLSKM